MSTQLISQNSKLKETSKETGLRVFNFGITAYKSETGLITCPFADLCVNKEDPNKSTCYAQNGAYRWPVVRNAYEYRFNATLESDFAERMTSEIKRKKVQVLRVHDAGDYYSPKYLKVWFEIMRNNPDVHFYSYTNSVIYFKQKRYTDLVPDNFDVIFSDMGKHVHMINKLTDRHTKVFNTVDQLNASGYINASKNDLFATRILNPDNNRIGLLLH